MPCGGLGMFPGIYYPTGSRLPPRRAHKKAPRKRCCFRGAKVAATYSPALRGSTIGACGLNFSVRDGKRWGPAAMAALMGDTLHTQAANSFSFYTGMGNTRLAGSGKTSPHPLRGGAPAAPAAEFRAISSARLWRRRLYTCALSTSSSRTALMRKSNLGAGFALRCFQRLSTPGADTRRCGWRHNR